MGPIASALRLSGCVATSAALLLCADVSRADEAGASFWLPGQYASLAAVQQTPGWALGVSYFHASVGAAGNVAAAREILIGGIPATAKVDLNLSLSGRADLVTLAPSYTFATPVLGGQLFVSMSSQYGRNTSSVAGTLTAVSGTSVVTRSGMLDGSLTSYGDLVPNAALLWSHGVDNYMVYVTGNIPAGDYNPRRLVNIGLGHGAIDAGGAYTYQNAATGAEFSAVAGLTYNLKNPSTEYRSGIDFHFDWGAAHFLTKQLFVGLAGYAYQEITDDSGQNPILGRFRSRAFGVGPQIGYNFPMGHMQGFLGLRGYGEFDTANRAHGWNTWLTFAISQPEPNATTPAKHLATK
jgi:hypothetical protein